MSGLFQIRMALATGIEANDLDTLVSVPMTGRDRRRLLDFIDEHERPAAPSSPETPPAPLRYVPEKIGASWFLRNTMTGGLSSWNSAYQHLAQEKADAMNKAASPDTKPSPARTATPFELQHSTGETLREIVEGADPKPETQPPYVSGLSNGEWKIGIPAALPQEGEATPETHDPSICGCEDHADYCPFNPTASLFTQKEPGEWLFVEFADARGRRWMWRHRTWGDAVVNRCRRCSASLDDAEDGWTLCIACQARKPLLEEVASLRSRLSESELLAARTVRAEQSHATIRDDLLRVLEERDQARSQLLDWENREAACCPEDVGFEELVESLRSRLFEAEQREEKNSLVALDYLKNATRYHLERDQLRSQLSKVRKEREQLDLECQRLSRESSDRWSKVHDAVQLDADAIAENESLRSQLVETEKRAVASSENARKYAEALTNADAAVQRLTEEKKALVEGAVFRVGALGRIPQRWHHVTADGDSPPPQFTTADDALTAYLASTSRASQGGTLASRIQSLLPSEP